MTFLCIFIAGTAAASNARQAPAPGAGKTVQTISAAAIINRLIDRYGNRNFSADFLQESTLKAMDITDTATGTVWFRHPGMMRWEYKTPEEHIIITDGKTLWVYKPADDQVIIGNAKNYFSDGNGASFLSNIGLIKKAFTVTLDQTTDTNYRLKMVPQKKQLDLSVIYLTISRSTFDIQSVKTVNAYGDDTRIMFSNLKFDPHMTDALFKFKVPQGADIIRMDNDSSGN